MKQLLLWSAISLFAIPSFSQITVTVDHIAKLNDLVYMADDTIHGTSLSLGSASGNQVWDFTSLVKHDQDTVLLEAPSTAPFSSHFPTATFVINDLEDDSSHLFFKRSSVGLDIVGIVEYENGAPALPEVNFAMRFMQFPVTIGTTFDSKINAGAYTQFLGVDPDSLGPHPRIDSIRNKVFILIENEMDAWGDLKLPQGTYPTLRQRTVNITKVSSDAYMNGSWQPFTPLILAFTDSVSYDTSEVSYRWWSSNEAANFMCAEVNLDSNELPESDVSFIVATPANNLGISSSAKGDFARIYPNPVSDQLFIDLGDTPVRHIQLIHSSGKEMLSRQANSPQIHLEMDQIPEGFYLLLVYGPSDHPVAMQKIQVRH